jgi:hypothetical protein
MVAWSIQLFSGAGRAVDLLFAQALQGFPTPTDHASLQSLLGSLVFWRQYIQGYAQIAQPLTALTSDAVPWCWTSDHDQAMSQLQAALLSSPVLMHPDQSKPFFVVTNASDCAVGASLEQEDDEGNRHPVAFLSHSLTSAERKYPNHERELLTIVIALRS